MNVKEYSNGEITILWKPAVCIHAGVCVKTLPEVYHPQEKPWITIGNASSAELIQQVSKCPSGALSIQPSFSITQEDDSRKGVFISAENGTQAGLMTYTWAGEDRFIIDHTEVSKGFNGRGVGKELVMAAVYFAREHKKKIIPLCPFAKNFFDKTPEIRDVFN